MIGADPRATLRPTPYVLLRKNTVQELRGFCMSGPLRGLGAPVGDQRRERLILTAWAAFWLVTAYLLIASCMPS